VRHTPNDGDEDSEQVESIYRRIAKSKSKSTGVELGA
jgi:hypothetical protein